MLKINIQGLDGMKKRFEEAALKVSPAGLTMALNEAGGVVQDAAKMNCPVDTGTLRNSIAKETNGNECLIGPSVNYGAYVEFGTGSKGDKSVSHTTKKSWTYYSGGRFYTTSGQAPKPFLVPALKMSKDKIREIFNQFLRGL